MYHFARTLLLSIFWLAGIIIVPYIFFAYVCYAGICGGDLAAAMHYNKYITTTYGYYIWVYPFMGIASTVYSARLKNKFMAFLVVLIPFIGSIPLAYVYHQENLIKNDVLVSTACHFKS